MSTQTDIPTLAVASFERRDGETILRARTKDGVDVTFKVDVMALAIMGITIDGALQAERDLMRAQMGEAPKPPAAPDSPEGLEG